MGCHWVDVAEDLAHDRAKNLFGAVYANVQPHRGSQATGARSRFGASGRALRLRQAAAFCPGVALVDEAELDEPGDRFAELESRDAQDLGAL